MTTRRSWTRDELILAMNLYCQLPFGRLHAKNPEIIDLATAIERTPSSVAMKLCNFASLDPAHQQRGVKGLSGASSADREIWDEFHADWNALVIESERLRAKLQQPSPSPEGAAEEIGEFVGATETTRMTNVRLAQRFFRRAVLASYDSRCCISQISHPDLLIASHIVPWRKAPEHRANPRNGLCLSRIHDGAFDSGLITLDEDMRLVISTELSEYFENATLKTCFRPFAGRAISLPDRFRADLGLLSVHREQIFRG